MKTEDLITVDEFCQQYDIEYTFFDSLDEHGLIEFEIIENSRCFPRQRVSEIERMMRLHYELEINMPGIEAINSLLDRLNEMQERMRTLENKLRIYE